MTAIHRLTHRCANVRVAAKKSAALHHQLRVDTRRVANATFVVGLPFPPSLNNLFLNVRGLGRIRSPGYTEWRREAATVLMAQRSPCAVGPVEISITFEERKGRRDLDNLVKPILDCLVENGIIDGDHNKVVRKLSAQWGDVIGALVEIAPAPLTNVERNAGTEKKSLSSYGSSGNRSPQRAQRKDA